MNPEKIGKFICELRKEQNLSQYQLADMIPITRQGVSKWERGVTTPDPQTLLRLSELFDVSINELLTGGRLETNSIEDLEKTTLSILDQSNKKTILIKRIVTASVSIITLLLLAFLSYYFINSYNSIKVYTISGYNNQFNTNNGVLISTKGKSYIKLGKLRHDDNIEIKSIELYYMKNNKKMLIAKDNDIDNLTIMESYGYESKLTKEDLKYIVKNSYLIITYNDNQTAKIKLKYKKDFNNDSLFMNRQATEIEKSVKITIEDTPKMETQVVEKEETPKDNEGNKNETIENKMVPEPTKTPEPESTPVISQELEITPELIINKIKENCSLDFDSYVCVFDNTNITVMYYESLNQIAILEENDMIQYFPDIDEYICSTDNCKEQFEAIISENLID